ncbi:MAG: hypothetical protein L0Z62_10295 [Gemmataceae bacterium]|nr:hypothetical protein [Gemmataceae bacterium]
MPLGVAHLKVGELYALAAAAPQLEFKQLVSNGAVRLLEAICRLVTTLASHRAASKPRRRPRRTESADVADALAGTMPSMATAASEPVPAEAQTGAARQHQVRERRQRDPLGEGQPCTWWQLVIKVAAEVVVSVRRVVVRLSSSWPQLGWYRRVCERLRLWEGAQAVPG